MEEQSKTILLVEDDAKTAWNIIKSLEDEGYVVVQADCGEEAIKIAGSSADKIDLILMDIDLDGEIDSSGTALEILKNYDIPVVFLYSDMETENIERTERLPSYGYILKNSGHKVLSASLKTAFKLSTIQQDLKFHKMKSSFENLNKVNGQPDADNLYLKEKNNLNRTENNSCEFNQFSRKLLENSGEAIFITRDYAFKYVNPRTTALTGYTEQEMFSRPFIEFIVQEDRDKIIDLYHIGIKGGLIPPGYQFRLICKDGSLIWVELKAILIKWEGKPALLSFVTDITERKTAEESLKSGREILSLAVELSKIGPWEFDFKTGNFIFSDEFYNIYGTSAAREGVFMTGEKYARELVHPDDAFKVKEELDKGTAINAREHSVNIEHRIIRRDGEVRTIVVLAKILKDSAGKLIKWYGANQDITDRKLTEEKLKRLVSEKEILLKELQHRVKNNMNIISSLLFLGMEKITDEKAGSVFSDAISRIRSMSSIYEQLCNLDSLAKIDLNIYIKNLADSIFKTYNIDLNKAYLTVSLEDFDLDFKKMIPVGLILNELITNALKYAYPGNAGGEIRISFQKLRDRIILSVADDGIGMPDNFDVRKPSTMGLTLVSILAKQIDGEMEIEGKNGTSVSINFKS